MYGMAEDDRERLRERLSEKPQVRLSVGAAPFLLSIAFCEYSHALESDVD
jgi:hypothetical protein